MSVWRMAAAAAEMRTDFPLPTLQVDTTDGYRPDIGAVLAFATQDHDERVAGDTGRADVRQSATVIGSVPASRVHDASGG